MLSSSKRAPLRAILFDLDGTLRRNEPPGVETFHRMAEDMGVVASLEQRRRAERWLHAYWAQSAELEADLRNADGQPGPFWTQHARRHLMQLGVGEDRVDDLARALTKRMLHEYQPVSRVPDGAFATLDLLRAEGYQLGLVSNRETGLAQAAAEVGLARFFDLMLAAGEVGLWKPDPNLLLHAVSEMSVLPEQAAYVGDNYFADVLCARQAGLVPVLMDPSRLYSEPDCLVVRSIEELPLALRMLAAHD
jgi:HAD superfamily hydrolase (TIGR01549 family)